MPSSPNPRRTFALKVLVVLVRAAVCLVLLGAASAVYIGLRDSRPVPARSDRARLAPRVMVMAGRPVEVNRQWRGFGSARAIDSADVPARVTATVIELAADVMAGRFVEKGELVVGLDASDFEREVEMATQSIADVDAQRERMAIELESWRERTKLAQQQVELAQAELDRATVARERGSARQREVDVAKQALINAIRDETVAREEYDKLVPRRNGLEAQRQKFEAQRKLASLNVDRCRITSPITGVIQDVDVEIGESLVAGQRVARVVDVTRVEVPLRLPSSARASVRVGDRVTLELTGSDRRKWETAVTRIAPEDDESTRTMTVFAEVEQDGAAGGLAPGQFVMGTVSCAGRDERWVIPRRSVSHDRMFLAEDNRLALRDVDADFEVEASFPQLGLPDRQWVVLTDPLPAGALVVITPSRALADGMQVRPVVVGDATHAAGDGIGADGSRGALPDGAVPGGSLP